MTAQRRSWTNPVTKTKTVLWTVDFTWKNTDGTKRRFREKSPVNTRQGAETYERSLREQLLAGTYEKKPTPTLAEFEARFLTYAQNANKPSEVAAKKGALKNHLLPFFGHTPLDRITLEHIENFKSEKLADDLTPKSVNNYLAILRKALNFAMDSGVISFVLRFKMLPVTKNGFEFLHFDEVERFRAVVDAEWAAMAVVAYRTGLRLGELLSLKWADIDLPAGRLFVRTNVWGGIEGTPKSGKGREVPLMDEAAAVLQGHRHLKGPYVFCQADGAPITHNMTRTVIPRACQRAGLAKRLTWHDLRHTFASHLVMRGVPLMVVKEYLGHADLTTTMIYAHLEPKERHSWIRKLEATAGSPNEVSKEST
jgi:integrase